MAKKSDELEEFRKFLSGEKSEIQEKKRRREVAEQKTRDMTLPEFLDACHIHLHLNLTVQHPKYSTQGSPPNRNRKLRPEYLRKWEGFEKQQEDIWNNVVDTDFFMERHFPTPNQMVGYANQIMGRAVGSKQELHTFHKQSVGDHTASIVNKLYDNPTLRQKFGLKGPIEFRDHFITFPVDSKQGKVEKNWKGKEESTELQAQPCT